MRDREKRKQQKNKGFGVWGFIILAGTIKEVCTRLMLLYLTKTEKEEKGKSFRCREQQRFLPSLLFSALFENGDSLKNAY